MYDDPHSPTLVPLDTAADLSTLLADAEPTIGIDARILARMAAEADRDAARVQLATTRSTPGRLIALFTRAAPHTKTPARSTVRAWSEAV
ncbi:MAG: hypothetical protein ACI8PZ_005514 [Myxococcota bacterium]|jgi:hypothetical protein